MGPWPAAGAVIAMLPDFGLSSAVLGDFSGFDGTAALSVQPSTGEVKVSRAGDGTPAAAGASLVVTVTGVVNRAWVNAVGAMHSLRTVDASDVTLEEAPDAGILILRDHAEGAGTSTLNLKYYHPPQPLNLKY